MKKMMTLDWIARCLDAFGELKDVIIKELILRLSDVTKDVFTNDLVGLMDKRAYLHIHLGLFSNYLMAHLGA